VARRGFSPAAGATVKRTRRHCRAISGVQPAFIDVHPNIVSDGGTELPPAAFI
jgi:hypothetical protein